MLDRKFGYPPDRPLISDDEIKRLIEDYVVAAKRAEECGFDFVDVKHCHGYLGHEFLSARRRGPAFTAAAWKIAPVSCAKSSKGSAPRRRG